ncbi:MAG TPA: carboxypeptidase-like regulatory domain-containing protein [Isosphaeraceae bacterium]
MSWAGKIVAIGLIAGLAGCGAEGERIALVPVFGKITRNGKPLARAKVSFVPAPANKESTVGVDETGPEGDYRLKFKGQAGVAPGKYRVFVTPFVELPGGNLPGRVEGDPKMGQMAAGVGVPGRERSKLARGTKREASHFEFDADVSGKGGEYDFDCKAS